MKSPIKLPLSLLVIIAIFTAHLMSAHSQPAPTLYTHNQTLTSEQINAYILSHMPTTTATARAYIKETSTIDFRHPTVQTVATNILSKSNATTEQAKLHAINDYLQDNFSYSLTAEHTIQTASEALTSGTNVCNGYSLAMVALLNAMDIPAAYVQTIRRPPSRPLSLRQAFASKIGTLTNGKTSFFHCTVLAFIGNEWLEIDPTINIIGVTQKQFASGSLYVLVAPPGQTHHSTKKPTISRLTPADSHISIDAHPVTEFPTFTCNGETFLPIKALATAMQSHSQTPTKNFDVSFTNATRFNIGTKDPPTGKVTRWINSVTAVINQNVTYPTDTPSPISDYHTTEIYGRDIGMPIYISGIAQNLTALQGITRPSAANSPSSVVEYFIEMEDLLRTLDISITLDPTTSTYLLDTTKPYTPSTIT